MEEVIDCINAASSPEELAINFLMRHARCRMALTGWTDENILPQAPAGSAPNAAARLDNANVTAQAVGGYLSLTVGSGTHTIERALAP